MALSEMWLSFCRFARQYCVLTNKSCAELHKNPVQGGETDEHEVVAKKKKMIFSNKCCTPVYNTTFILYTKLYMPGRHIWDPTMQKI